MITLNGFHCIKELDPRTIHNIFTQQYCNITAMYDISSNGIFHCAWIENIYFGARLFLISNAIPFYCNIVRKKVWCDKGHLKNTRHFGWKCHVNFCRFLKHFFLIHFTFLRLFAIKKEILQKKQKCHSLSTYEAIKEPLKKPWHSISPQIVT